jgi:hypothetical protein
VNITEFLLERIAEDEAVARAAAEMLDGPNWANDGTCVASGENAFWVDGLHARSPELAADHIARHDPARVLAECAAKRAIVTYLQGLTADRNRDAEIAAQYRATHWIAEKLAAIYSDHPDYLSVRPA